MRVVTADPTCASQMGQLVTESLEFSVMVERHWPGCPLQLQHTDSIDTIQQKGESRDTAQSDKKINLTRN